MPAEDAGFGGVAFVSVVPEFHALEVFDLGWGGGEKSVLEKTATSKRFQSQLNKPIALPPSSHPTSKRYYSSSK